MKTLALTLALAFFPRPPVSLEYRESTSRPQYERILRAIEESRESRKAQESEELRAAIDKAIRERP